eukprot:15445807-Alexandrium_andersonii.AAC.1
MLELLIAASSGKELAEVFAAEAARSNRYPWYLAFSVVVRAVRCLALQTTNVLKHVELALARDLLCLVH